MLDFEVQMASRDSTPVQVGLGCLSSTDLQAIWVMKETLLIASVDFVPCSPRAEIEAQEVDLAEIAMDRQKGQEEDPLD